MQNKSFQQLLFIFSFSLAALQVIAQAPPTDTTGKPLPGKGLKQHSFLYAGEWDTRYPDAQKMSIVRNGKLVWQYTIPLHPSPGANQEFDDITMLPNGNIVFARMSGAGIVTPDKKLIWEFVCP